MDTELTSSMVPPSNPGPGLGFPPNPALSQETNEFLQTRQFPKIHSH